uniref:Uncharacterized protein n=1 Tax=Anguilla anguilla TaxID=7936 RepID=A0A0E9W9B9_ANGAN
MKGGTTGGGLANSARGGNQGRCLKQPSQNPKPRSSGQSECFAQSAGVQSLR